MSVVDRPAPRSLTVVTLSLGLQLWVVAGLVPWWTVPEGRRGVLLLSGPATLLAAGIWARPWLLLVAVPVATLLPLLPAEMARARPGGWAFLALAAALVAYLVAALRLTRGAALGEPAARTSLGAATTPRPLLPTIGALITLAWCGLWLLVPTLAATRRAVVTRWVDEGELAQAAIAAVGAAFLSLVVAGVILPAIGDQLDGAPAFQGRLRRARDRRRPLPRPAFFIAVSLSLILIVVALIVELRR